MQLYRYNETRYEIDPSSLFPSSRAQIQFKISISWEAAFVNVLLIFPETQSRSYLPMIRTVGRSTTRNDEDNYLTSTLNQPLFQELFYPRLAVNRLEDV